MYPPQFDYYRAGTVDEALALLKQHTGAKLLAGGHSLIPALKLRLSGPDALIDIGRIAELKGIRTQNGTISIGALTTHATVAAAPDLPAVMTDAAGQIGDPQVRNRGTVGGNIAHADPASDWPTVLVALGAMINVVGPKGRRSVLADDFFVDLFATNLDEDELVTSIDVTTVPGAGSAYAKLANPASRYAILGAAAVIAVRGGVCSAAGVAIGGLTPVAMKARAVEAALVGQPLNEATIEAAAAQITSDLGDNVNGDIHASAEYRAALAPIYVARAISQAAARAA